MQTPRRYGLAVHRSPPLAPCLGVLFPRRLPAEAPFRTSGSHSLPPWCQSGLVITRRHYPIPPGPHSSSRGDPQEAEAVFVEILRDHGSSPSNASTITARAAGYAVLLATASGSSTRSGSGPLRTGSGARAGAEVGMLRFRQRDEWSGGCLEQTGGGASASPRIAGNQGGRGRHTYVRGGVVLAKVRSIGTRDRPL
jgi:hypothetical protein